MESQKYIVEVSDGKTVWKNERGKFSRPDGPAIETTDGYKAWYLDGKVHRLNGHAREWANGMKEWWVNDQLSRLDGPAIESSDGEKYWYIDGVRYSEEEFNKKVQEIKNGTPNPRFRVEQRTGIVAIYDTHHPEYEDTNGCHGDYPWVVCFWMGIYIYPSDPRCENDWGHWIVE